MEKQLLRKKFIALRKNYSGKKDADVIIIKKILNLSEWKKANVVCIYTSLPNEVDTKQLLQSKKHIILPEEDTTHVDLYIVPGVAFDRNGNRLGRGGGYYDRLLQNKKAIKIGLAYEMQMVAEAPHTRYDVPMDMVVTETEIYENKTS